MKFYATALVTVFLFSVAENPSHASDFAFGADLSFLKQAEDRGTVFKDGTNATPGLQIFKNHGYNWIRLRIFVEPVGGNLPNDLAYTLAEAKDAKKLGYKFLLDFHYASTWADPGKQPTPEAWLTLSHKHTRDALAGWQAAGQLEEFHRLPPSRNQGRGRRKRHQCAPQNPDSH